MLLAVGLVWSQSIQAQNAKDTVIAVDEVVITALGVKSEKKKVGYAVQEVQGSTLVKSREPNAINSLVGKVAGLTVGPSAEMLSAPQLVLRGSDIRRGQSVLFVVDGVPINSDSWNISPDDIESYTVLKGPSAAALYGYRGQNGAIVITTKRASKKGVVVEYNSSSMIESGFLTIPKVQDKFGPGDHGRYGFVDGRGSGLNDGDYDVWGPEFGKGMWDANTNSYLANLPQYDSPINPLTGERTATPWIARGKDNLKRFIQPGALMTNNVSIANSTEKSDVRFSFTNTYQRGIIPNTQLNTYNFNVSNTVRFSKKFRMDATLNYNRQATDNVPDVVYGPNSVIYNVIIWTGADWDVDAEDIRGIWKPGKEGVESVFAEYQRYHNPWFTSYHWLRGHYKNDTYGYTALTYDFSDKFNVLARTSITTYDLFRNEKMPFSAHPYGREENRGDYREDRRSMFENNTEFLANYKDQLGALSLDAKFGGNIRTFAYNSNFTSTNYLLVPGVYNFANSANPVLAYNFDARMAVNSLYADVNAGVRGLNLNGTLRRDQISTLPIDNNAYIYPGASLSFIPTEFMNTGKTLSFAKLRASVSQAMGGLTSPLNGGAGYPIGYGTRYYSTYEGPSYENSAAYSVPLVYEGRPAAYYTNTVSNAGLQPFKRTNFEFGGEARLFYNRLGVDAAYFIYNDGPGIFSRSISSATGYTNALVNGIETQRRGWELTLNGTVNKAKKVGGFNWDLGANFSSYGEYLTNIYDGVDKIASNYFVSANGGNRFLELGDRIDAIYASGFRMTPDGQLINDAGGRPITTAQSKFLGYALPKLVWGATSGMSYKNFRLNVQFDGRVGGVVVNQIERQTYRGGRAYQSAENNLKDANGLGMYDARVNDAKGVKSWLGTGVTIVSGTPIYDDNGVITNMDELVIEDNSTVTYLQDYLSRYKGTYEGNLMSKTYFKLRDITLSYDFPENNLPKGLSAVSLSFVARNVLYWAPNSASKLQPWLHSKNQYDVDMDQFPGMTAYTDLQTPTLRRFGFNLNVKF
jgi:TonB-linked SusC/RagA family outer membrane protein